MEHQHARKRPLMDYTTVQPVQQYYYQPKMVSTSTSTDDHMATDKPMMLTSWTQTSAEDFAMESYSTQKDNQNDLAGKIEKLEEALQAQSLLIAQLQNVSLKPSSVNYRIIADGNGSEAGLNFEPIEVEIAEEEVTDSPLNASDDSSSGRLEINLKQESQIINYRQQQQALANASPEPMSREVVYHHQATPQLRVPAAIKVERTYRPASSTPTSTTQRPKSRQQRASPRNNDAQAKASPSADASFSAAGMPDLTNIVVSIGPNNTRIPAKIYESMNWNSASIATRKLLTAIFDRETLATHTMTGKPSPAFKEQDKPLKHMLNAEIIADIIFAVTRKCSASEKEVRNAITTKCADENKMYKLQQQKRASLKELNKENLR